MICLLVIIVCGIWYSLEHRESKRRWNMYKSKFEARGWSFKDFEQWDKEKDQNVKSRLELIFDKINSSKRPK